MASECVLVLRSSSHGGIAAYRGPQWIGEDTTKLDAVQYKWALHAPTLKSPKNTEWANYAI